MFSKLSPGSGPQVKELFILNTMKQVSSLQVNSTHAEVYLDNNMTQILELPPFDPIITR